VRQARPILWPRTKLKSDHLRRNSGVQSPGTEPAPLDPASRRRPLSTDRWGLQRDASLNEMLSSAVGVQDKELARILHDVDEILKTAKADCPEIRAISTALQSTVVCAVKQSLLERELRSLALTDDLTCLYNRRAFLALAAQQVRLMRRKGEGLLVFFADVDHLKEINDSYGHREGDLALIRTADALEQTFRDSDIIARLGGDEFGVLALEASGHSQEVILRRLHENLQESSTDESRYELSLSVGVARLDPRRTVSLGELLEQADLAMYEEKRKKGPFQDFRSARIERALR